MVISHEETERRRVSGWGYGDLSAWATTRARGVAVGGRIDLLFFFFFKANYSKSFKRLYRLINKPNFLEKIVSQKISTKINNKILCACLFMFFGWFSFVGRRKQIENLYGM